MSVFLVADKAQLKTFASYDNMQKKNNNHITDKIMLKNIINNFVE